MIAWFFKKFLCPYDIHKVEQCLHELKLICLDDSNPRHFCHCSQCKYCKAIFDNYFPPYEQAPLEMMTIKGKNPFIYER